MKNQLMSLLQFYSYIDGSLHVSGPQAHPQEISRSCSHNRWFSFCTVFLYRLSVPSFCTVFLYLLSIPSFCTVLLYRLSVPSFCTVFLYRLFVPSFCTVFLY